MAIERLRVVVEKRRQDLSAIGTEGASRRYSTDLGVRFILGGEGFA
jgi:hypothetical protein